ncbi:hypothetical protein YC2023_068402 [Brassica napus]
MSGLNSDKRDFYGVYPITGKVLIVRKASPAQINRNKFIQDLKKILKLELQKDKADLVQTHNYIFQQTSKSLLA